MATDQPVSHEFEDADTGDEMIPEKGVTYAVITSFLDVGDLNGQLVFTHRLREA